MISAQGLGDFVGGSFPLDLTYTLRSKSSSVAVVCFVTGDFISCLFLTEPKPSSESERHLGGGCVTGHLHTWEEASA